MISDYSPLSPLATNVGLACVIVQVIFTLLFDERAKIIPAGPWSSLRAFTAHKVVTLPAMILLTYCGVRDWFFLDVDKYAVVTPYDRIFGMSNPNDIPLAYGIGAMLMWDIPISILSPPMRDPLMFVHHVAMFFVAYTMSGGFCEGGNMIGYYYAPFYFGVIEFSSIPLTYVNVFHPKVVHYHEWTMREQSNEGLESLRRLVIKTNAFARVSFAASFLALRGIYFPYVSFAMTLPDLIAAYRSPPPGVPMWTGYVLISSIALFSCLQAYWGVLVARQVLKTIRSKEIKIHDA
ncbi:hypothetical protein ACHAXA_005112 [Cyclostephanos tholiformis]|uniref:TLC domain-containing protein n=1 Tax=Cyclostephanos tholiformis TaxID=382380 RepID=A0ABD3RX77_9STRA